MDSNYAKSLPDFKHSDNLKSENSKIHSRIIPYTREFFH